MAGRGDLASASGLSIRLVLDVMACWDFSEVPGQFRGLEIFHLAHGGRKGDFGILSKEAE